MSESELRNLELQIDSVVESFQQLNRENGSLRKKIDSLAHERAMLLDKKQKISRALKTIIAQLQDELSCQIQ